LLNDRNDDRTMTDSFEPAAFWEERLADAVGLQQVGHRGFGLQYNKWLYRVRVAQFRRRALKLLRGRDISALRVLDIGSGSGVYIDQWLRLGVNDLVGVDLTESAVRHLGEKFPDAEFHQGDLGDPTFLHDQEGFDVISAFDMLFHIVDDDRFDQALANVGRLLAADGVFIYTDLLVHGSGKRSPHHVTRTLKEHEVALARAGLTIAWRRPVFVFMEAPVDSASRIHRKTWSWWKTMAGRSEGAGFIAGAFAFPVELAAAALLREGPSIEMVACRRIDRAG
jgi:SAM-dependent methyltransferase